MSAGGTFEATVHVAPRGKGSVRVMNGRAYKDPATEAYMRTLIVHFRAAHRGPPLDGTLALAIDAFLARPKSLVPNPRARTPQPPAAAFLAPCKPDADNIAKAVGDALTQAGVVVDDCRVAELLVRRWYVAVDGVPRVVVRVGPSLAEIFTRPCADTPYRLP